MISTFGTLADGREVHAVSLGSPDLLQAQVLTYGGILRELTFFTRGIRHSLVVSLPDLDAYVRDTAFVGVLIGRVANRIAGAKFFLNGKEHRVTANEGSNHLHGGELGFGKRLWRIVEHDGVRRLKLALHSPAGEEGYPGNLNVTAEYVIDGCELTLRIDAHADEDTLFNPTFHPYFKLPPGGGELTISAGHYLPVAGTDSIPTGEVRPVGSTPFDFQRPGLIAQPLDFDHCWALEQDRLFDAELRLSTDLRLVISSNRPGMQFYGGKHSPELHAICLEPQGWPNAANVPTFPSIVLRSGTIFSTTCSYRAAQTSRLVTDSAFFSMNSRRGST